MEVHDPFAVGRDLQVDRAVVVRSAVVFEEPGDEVDAFAACLSPRPREIARESRLRRAPDRRPRPSRKYPVNAASGKHDQIRRVFRELGERLARLGEIFAAYCPFAGLVCRARRADASAELHSPAHTRRRLHLLVARNLPAELRRAGFGRIGPDLRERRMKVRNAHELIDRRTRSSWRRSLRE